MCAFLYWSTHSAIQSFTWLVEQKKLKKKSIKKFITCYIFYKMSRKQYAESSVISVHWELKTRSKPWMFVMSLQALALLEIGVATREHVSICISALGFFLITTCLMQLLHNLWSWCQNSSAFLTKVKCYSWKLLGIYFSCSLPRLPPLPLWFILPTHDFCEQPGNTWFFNYYYESNC